MYEFLDTQVQEVMSSPPVTVTPATTLGEAQALFDEHGFNALPVVESAGQLVGWVTTLDLLRAFDFSEDTILPDFAEVMKQPVERVMSRDLLTVWPRTPVTRLVAKMVDTRSKSFPVVDDERLVGVVSRDDVLRALRQALGGKD
jgi:CBS domain-containing protein